MQCAHASEIANPAQQERICSGHRWGALHAPVARAMHPTFAAHERALRIQREHLVPGG